MVSAIFFLLLASAWKNFVPASAIFFFMERTVPKKYRFLMFSFTTENALLTHLYKEFREFLSIFRMKRYYNGSLLTHFYKKMP